MSSAGTDPGQQAAALARVGRAMGCGPRGCLMLLVILAGGIVASVGLDWALRAVFDPWSVPLGGRPTLTGEWVGTLKTASAMRFGLGLRIDYHERPSGRGGGSGSRIRIDGDGQLCNQRGESYAYNLSGSTDDWAGSRSHITMGSVDTSVNGSGWGFDVRWEGNRLTLVGVNDSFELDQRPTGGRSSLAELDPYVGDLKRGSLSGLETVCRGLAEAR